MECQKGFYRHFKGNIYEVLWIAKHSETMEDLVIYRSAQNPDLIWARPLSIWNKTVERDGQAYKRFTFIGETLSQG